MVQSSSKSTLTLGANQIRERPDHARGALVSAWRVPLAQKASASTSHADQLARIFGRADPHHPISPSALACTIAALICLSAKDARDPEAVPHLCWYHATEDATLVGDDTSQIGQQLLLQHVREAVR